ncbi:hypothetical protein [Rhizobium tubonense]|nr:hypothetical protein [Rhizobium tubonense]
MTGNRIVLWLMPRTWRILTGCLALTACSQFSSLKPPPDPVYDVRSAVVVSGPGIAPALLTATNDRINAAIAATTHNTTLPSVVLTVHVVQVEKAQGFQHDRNTAKINIDATSVDTGSVIAVASLETTTFSPDTSIVDDLMAEDIAARIRSTFALKTPPLGS